MEAEREIYRRMGVVLMRGHVGETFPGIISGLAECGIFVEIGATMTEGMVRFAELRDDYYVHYPERRELRGDRTGKTYRLGQEVVVTVTDVSMARLEIDLAFARDASGAGGPGRIAGTRGDEKTGRVREPERKGRHRRRGRPGNRP
jgi:ribonuclease R